MFIDHARIHVTAGAGGNGCVSFRREKYVPRGGPDGGDGGDGGDVVLVATKRLNSLNHLRYHSTWKGRRGVHGRGSGMHGKRGEETRIDVPVGTTVTDLTTGEAVADLAEEGARYVVAHGGSGGRGNARFVSSLNRAPRFAENGEPGEHAEVELELKLIADVGLVGLPNAGKSTFLRAVSGARPKVGDYPFTTISPHLGVAELSGYRTVTIADIPGIIEGAAEGKGLGHEFLRHIERTRVLLFLIDPTAGSPEETFHTLRAELTAHSERFSTRPYHVAYTKADLPDVQALYEARPESMRSADLVSAATGQGVESLLESLWDLLQRADAEQEDLSSVKDAAYREHRAEAPFTIHEAADGFAVEGRKVVRAVRMTDFANEEAVRHLDRELKKMGVYHALKRRGASDGQTIHIGDIELEYHE